MPPTPLVFVVDDDVSVRESLELLIVSEGWRAESFASAQEFLARDRAHMQSCLLLDVSLPDIDGLEIQRRVADRAEMPIIFISGHGDVPMTVRAMRGGATEFLTKPLDGNVVVPAIRTALEISRVVLEHNAGLCELHTRHGTLSRREREVMGLVVSGMLNKQVGGELGISEITVKAHRGQVMRKMMASSLADLVRLAARLTPQAKS